MFRKLLVASVSLLALTAVISSPSQAQYGPAVAPSDSVVTPGEPITITGSGFPPEVTVTLTLVPIRLGIVRAAQDGSVMLGTTTTTADGTFAAEVTIPADARPGSYVVRAQHGDLYADTPIEIAGDLDATPTTEAPAPGAAPGDEGAGGASLPRTGTDTAPYLAAGAGLLAIGGMVLLASRNRRRSSIAG